MRKKQEEVDSWIIRFRELEGKYAEISVLRAKINEQDQQIQGLKSQIDSLYQQLSQKDQELEKWRQQYAELERNFRK